MTTSKEVCFLPNQKLGHLVEGRCQSVSGSYEVKINKLATVFARERMDEWIGKRGDRDILWPKEETAKKEVAHLVSGPSKSLRLGTTDGQPDSRRVCYPEPNVKRKPNPR